MPKASVINLILCSFRGVCRSFILKACPLVRCLLQPQRLGELALSALANGCVQKADLH